MKNKLLKTQKLNVVLLALLSGLSFVNVAAASEDKSKNGDFARGATAWVNNCVRCHNVRDPKELRDDQWITTTYHMRIRAGLTGQQSRDVIKFLQMSN
ncbi:hypothetical protein MNBD_GAMMA22-1682 [hydrothermal vent metagenome]|uniref:Cytochrome c, class I n=1 Tax=hydrothermal vent metagenome TaxID=652676 RepID=A0A3B1A061_9ZZZZ